jgi:hypothetical protein
LPPLSPGNPPVKDERWAVKTFRPLLRSLRVQNIPDPREMTVVYLADTRDLIIKGMGRCVVIIEQRRLAENIGGMLITSYDMDIDYFRLHIIINSSLCNKTDLEDRALQKITAVHEFTHTVAALSAISRVRSKELIERLKNIFRTKAHALYLTDLNCLANELRDSLSAGKNTTSQRAANTTYFPDEHFRLGFEDFPVSYPIVFDEFLFSREMFEEYLSKEAKISVCEAICRRDAKTFVKLIRPSIKKISQEKALYESFVASRVLDILISDYIKSMVS